MRREVKVRQQRICDGNGNRKLANTGQGTLGGDTEELLRLESLQLTWVPNFLLWALTSLSVKFTGVGSGC